MPRVSDPCHLANAVTVLPLAYLGFVARTPLQALLMWGLVCASVAYHALYAFGNVAAGARFYVADVALQVASLLALVVESECYRRTGQCGQGRPAVGAGLGLLCAAILVLGRGPVRHNRTAMMACACLAHLLHAGFAGLCACDRAALATGAKAMAVASALCAADELGAPYAWAVGHLCLVPYVYCFWNALHMLR